MNAELVRLHGERLDAFIGLAGCDKSIPAMLRAAARLDPNLHLAVGDDDVEPLLGLLDDQRIGDLGDVGLRLPRLLDARGRAVESPRSPCQWTFLR